MRTIDLFEMPLASFDLHGDWNDDRDDEPVDLDDDFGRKRPNNSFVARHDRRLVKNARIQDRVGKLLLNFPTPLHINLWNSKAAFYFYDNLDYGKATAEAIRHLPNQLRRVVATRDPQAITVILTHNEGGSSKHPLTPWMILHRVAHALDGGVNNIFTRLKEVMLYCYDSDDKVPNKVDITIAFLNAICTFKAARENKVILDGNSYGEGFTEMFVQYMVKGYVPFNEPPKILSVGDINYHVVRHDKLAQVAKSFEEQINDHFANVIARSRGGAYIC